MNDLNLIQNLDFQKDWPVTRDRMGHPTMAVISNQLEEITLHE
jgi:hypothetical protein